MTEAEKTEAHEALLRCAHKVIPNRDAVRDAYRDLLVEIGGLGSGRGYAVTVAPDDTFRLRVQRVDLYLASDADGIYTLRSFQNGEPKMVKGLLYNPVAGKIESSEIDQDIVPTSGQRFLRKSAVRVVVETAVHRIESISADGKQFLHDDLAAQEARP